MVAHKNWTVRLLSKRYHIMPRSEETVRLNRTELTASSLPAIPASDVQAVEEKAIRTGTHLRPFPATVLTSRTRWAHRYNDGKSILEQPNALRSHWSQLHEGKFKSDCAKSEAHGWEGHNSRGAVTAVVSLDGHAMCSREPRSPCIQGKH